MSEQSGNNTLDSHNRTLGEGFVYGLSPGSTVLITFYALVAGIAFFSNMLILLTVFRGLVTRNTVNIFLSSLAISDLIMVLLSIFDCIAYAMGEGWTFGVALCKIQSFFIEVCFTASTLTLVVVSVERYLLICHPHMKRRTINSIYKILGIIWISALLVSSPLLHGYSVKVKKDDGQLRCSNSNWSPKGLRIFYGLFSFITYLSPLVIMAFAHWKISVAVKDNGRRSSFARHNTISSDHNSSVCFTIQEESSGESNGSTENTTTESMCRNGKSNGAHKSLLNSLKRRATQSTLDRDFNRREKRLKAIKLLFVVTVFFFILWTPFIILRLLDISGVKVWKYLYTFSEILIFSSTAVNGFIYAFMSPPFRKGFKAQILCQTRRELVSRDSGPSMSNSEDNRWMNHRMNSRGSSVSFHVEYSIPKNGHVSHVTIPANVYSTPKKELNGHVTPKKEQKSGLFTAKKDLSGGVLPARRESAGELIAKTEKNGDMLVENGHNIYCGFDKNEEKVPLRHEELNHANKHTALNEKQAHTIVMPDEIPPKTGTESS